MADRKPWCLCRWYEGDTTRVLMERREKRFNCKDLDPVSQLSFSGPLSEITDQQYLSIGIGRLGFPLRGQIGDVCTFETEEQAAEWAEQDGSHISIDVPTPVAELHFGVEEYRYGKTETIYDGGELHQARCEAAYRRVATAGDYQREVRVVCVPRWGVLKHRPSKEQGERINAKAREIHKR